MASLCAPAGAQQAPEMGTALYTSSQGPVELLPNPDFVFPARPVDAKSHRRQRSSIARRPRSDQNLAATANNTTHKPTHQTRASGSALPLPTFTFNPAASTQASSQSTPPLSPMTSGPPTPSRSRHRRGGSEFIGDGQASGNVSIVSSSPQRHSFSAPPPPAQITLGPPAGRRHAHRRSGAISCHDLASIVQSKDTNVQPRSGSAPTSPLDLEDKGFQFPIQAPVTPTETVNASSVDDASTAEQQPARRSFSRTRVGFADRVEYIRPLSTISSETESSMSTIRGHSVTGSWSSLASVTQMSPVRRGRPSLDTTLEVTEPVRPNFGQSLSAADSVPSEPIAIQRSDETRPKAETTAAGSPDLAATQLKAKSFSWWDSRGKRPSYGYPKPDIKETSPIPSSPPMTPKARHSLDCDQDSISTIEADADRKKPRKVKSWAHSLIARKHKSKQNLRPATPPATGITAASDDSDGNSLASDPDVQDPLMSFNFDEDNTVTIVDETSQSKAMSPQIPYCSARASQPVTDNCGPVIDLDMAMSPMRGQMSPTGRGQRQMRSRQSMHSATLTSGALNLASPHRRTESAPQLKPFELRSPQSFATSVMPDVFEEEDEEAEDDQTTMLSAVSLSPVPIPVAPKEQTVGPLSTSLPTITGFGNARSQKSGGLSGETGSRPSSLMLDASELASESVCDSAVDLKIVGADGSVGSPSMTEERSGTPFSDFKITAPPPLLYPVPLPADSVMTPGTVSDSSVYSPFFSPSQTSLVGPRLGTGTSSLNERSIFFFGEPGPELRASVDDVPSLSSSRSTMTSPAAHHGMPGSSGGGGSPSLYSIRSATTTDFGRHKRGSIASLTRLVADRIERSKLSIETRPVTSSADSTIKASKVKHRNKLSKLMSFWRSKESC